MTKIWPPSHEDYLPADCYDEQINSNSLSSNVWLRKDEEYVEESEVVDSEMESSFRKNAENENRFHEALNGRGSINFHFEWATLCLDGAMNELQKFEERSKNTLHSKKLKKTKTQKGKTKKIKKAIKNTPKKQAEDQTPPRKKQSSNQTKKRPCPCKKVHGWHGVFARSSQNGSKKYFILISLRGKKTYDGSYDTERDCAIAYDDLVVRERGLEQVIDKLNFPERYGIFPDESQKK